MLKGEDKYSILESPIKHTATAFNKICLDGLDTPQGNRKMLGKGGGDLKFINGSFGLAGCSHTNPCPWCTEKRSEFGGSSLHTRVQIEELSHAVPVPFRFPGCKTYFKTEADVDDYNKRNAQQYQQDHWGIKPDLCPHCI